MPRFKHPINKHERRLIDKAKNSRRNSRRKEAPMEELRTLELKVSGKHLEDQFMSFLDALTMIHPDEEIIEVEGLPIPKGDIPIKIKFCKRIQQESAPHD